jgi:DNA-binding MarR family transcriptional regulator
MIASAKEEIAHHIVMKSKEKLSTNSATRSKESIRTWLRLLSCEATIEQHLRSLFRDHFSVTLPQFDVLSELEYASEPLSMSQLSNKLMVSNGNVTGVVDRLEKVGFVRRSRAEHDRRIQFIQLTSKGRREFKRMASRHEKWLDQLLSGLTVPDMRTLQKLLLKTRNSVTAV